MIFLVHESVEKRWELVFFNGKENTNPMGEVELLFPCYRGKIEVFLGTFSRRLNVDFSRRQGNKFSFSRGTRLLNVSKVRVVE